MFGFKATSEQKHKNDVIQLKLNDRFPCCESELLQT